MHPDQLSPACFSDTMVTAVPHGCEAQTNAVTTLSLPWSEDHTSITPTTEGASVVQAPRSDLTGLTEALASPAAVWRGPKYPPRNTVEFMFLEPTDH